MLEVNVRINDEEFYDEETSSFFFETTPVRLEHSLLTVSAWEAQYKKPFLSDLEIHAKTDEEMVDYIRMMLLGSYPEEIFLRLIKHNLNDIQKYIGDAQTATTVNEPSKSKASSEIVTSELIYYWMFSSQIPKECETWHLNRLITLIRVFAAKQSKPEKKSASEIASRNRSLNAQRRAQLKSKG